MVGSSLALKNGDGITLSPLDKITVLGCVLLKVSTNEAKRGASAGANNPPSKSEACKICNVYAGAAGIAEPVIVISSKRQVPPVA